MPGEVAKWWRVWALKELQPELVALPFCGGFVPLCECPTWVFSGD